MSGASRALCMSSIGRLILPLSSSSVMSLAPTPSNRPANRLRPFDRLHHLQLHPLAGEALEVLARAQHPIQARRGHLERVLARDRILGIERLADCAADALAIVDTDAVRRIATSM